MEAWVLPGSSFGSSGGHVGAQGASMLKNDGKGSCLHQFSGPHFGTCLILFCNLEHCLERFFWVSVWIGFGTDFWVVFGMNWKCFWSVFFGFSLKFILGGFFDGFGFRFKGGSVNYTWLKIPSLFCIDFGMLFGWTFDGFLRSCLQHSSMTLVTQR